MKFLRKKCIKCGSAFSGWRAFTVDWCCSCSRLRERVMEKRRGGAHLQVKLAIKQGLIPKPTVFKCIDCGMPATCYEHRDYRKPLMIDPVCKRCDSLRGPAKPYLNSTRIKAHQLSQKWRT